jgi:subtilisin-like proprotein convertase family protein
MSHSNSVIHIKNNSWGPPDCDFSGTVLEAAGPLMQSAIAEGVATGRNGKGVIYTWAGGNGRECGENVNYDGFANSINVFAIGALTDHGEQSSYSEPGACLVLAAPSSDGAPGQRITTTDLTGIEGYNKDGGADLADLDYTQKFGGTSSAAPLAAGVIALVLQANPNLSYRDVKEILLRSSTKVQPADSDWSTNSAGIAHNHKFGAGLLNAQAAVTLATNWASLDPVTNVTLLQTNLDNAIPDYDSNGVTLSFTFSNLNFRVEHLTLTMTAPHSYWGNLAVTVTSPSGMQSRLADAHAPVDTNYNYQAWTFSSVRHWGEHANGTWTVKVADEVVGDTGTLDALELKLYGTMPTATLALNTTNQNIRLILHAAAPGWRYAMEAASNLGYWAPLTTQAIPTSGEVTFTDYGALLQNRRFYRARLLP